MMVGWTFSEFPEPVEFTEIDGDAEPVVPETENECVWAPPDPVVPENEWL